MRSTSTFRFAGAAERVIEHKRQLVTALELGWPTIPSRWMLFSFSKVTQRGRSSLAAREIGRSAVAARGGDVTASLRSLSSVGSVREELERMSDPEVTASIAYLKPTDIATIIPSMGQATSSGRRFEFRRPLARAAVLA